MMNKIKESALWQRLTYKAPIAEGEVGYFKFGSTIVFLERVKKMPGGRDRILELSRLFQRETIIDM